MTAVEDSQKNGQKLGSMAEHLNSPWQSIAEVEAALEQMARLTTPTRSTLGQLAEVLAEGGRDGGDAGLPLDDKELQLRKAQARYRALVEQIPAISFMAPLDGTVSELYVSPQIEQMLGYTAEEWLSNPILWYDRLHVDDKIRWQDEFARTLNAGAHFRSQYRFMARDGRVVWVHGEAKVIGDEDGRPLFLQGVAFDITERMEAEQKLQQQNEELALARDRAMEASRAKSAFLANMSHELRTPLHAIMGFSEMLYEDAADGGHDSFLPDLDKITSSAKHLVGLINNILDLSKIEAGRMELLLEDFAIEPMVQEILTTVLPLIEGNGNTLHVQLSPDIGSMHADQTKVRQVLLNLLSNAAKFTQRGQITLEASRLALADGEWIRLRVRDTGIGIASDQKDKLFQSFSQGDESTTRKYGGTGLGLAISQRFCQMMGGKITVQSELGKGTTFIVDLPAHVVPCEEPAAPSIEMHLADSTPAKGAELPAILVLAHDVQVQELMQRSLELMELRIVTAGCGAEGLELARKDRPVAILLDIIVPELDGLSVLAALKGDPSTADIPVLVFALASESGQGYLTGAADYLTKPIDEGRLSALLRRFKGGKSAPRVLIVHDEPDSREVLCRIADQGNWVVTQAENGWTGLKALGEVPPDLVLLDLTMPDMDGLAFLGLLRATQAGRAIPVVVATAQELTAAERTKLSGSVNKILQKGTLGRDDLLKEIDTLLIRYAQEHKAGSKVPPVSHDGATAPVPLVRAVQGQLGQVPAERTVALSLDRHIPTNGQTDPKHVQLEEALARTQQELREQRQAVELLRAEADELAQTQQELREQRQAVELLRGEADELAQTQQELREQQQAVKLLQAEAEEATTLREQFVQMRQEMEQLRRQRETAAAKPSQTEPPRPAPAAPDLAASVRQLEEEIESLRRQQRAPRSKHQRRQERLRKVRAAEDEQDSPSIPWGGSATSTLTDRRASRAAGRLGRAPAVAQGKNASAGMQVVVWVFPFVAALVSAIVLGRFLFR
jgi:PAS domain S-box-containing protein